MKKALSLAVALMMLMTMCFSISALAEEPEGSAGNPYYVANPMSAPNFITIPANSTVYYQYNVMVFNGWSVEGYGLSAITVDGMVYDTPGMWGALNAEFNFTMISPGLVGYVNDTAEDIDVMLTHNQPVGTLENPDQLQSGDNYFTIPASIMEYVTVYLPEVSGDFTFSTEQAEDFQITVFADASPAEGGTPNFVENGSLTMYLESYMPVYVVVSPIGMTGDAILTVTPPKAGTEANPLWLYDYDLMNTCAIEGGVALYCRLEGSMAGNTLTIESVAGADFTATIDGVEYASEGGILTVLLQGGDWCIDMVLSSAVDNEVAFAVEYAAGSMENPIELGMGDNTISIPAGVDSYYYFYTVEKDGLLIATPSDKSVIGYMDMADDYYDHFAYLMAESTASSMMIPVTAGEVISFSISGADDEETWEKLPVDITLNLSWKELVIYNTFESEELEGWGSSSNLTIDDVEYANGWYSAKFEVTADWGNIYNYITVEQNTEYEISFKVKGALAKNLWVKLNKEWTADVAQAAVAVTTEWAEYTVTLNSGDNTSLILMFQYDGVAADGQTLWLDDVVMTKYVAPSEPETPDEPSEPSEPTEPSEPETPEEPSEPSEPTEPSEPETPDEPTEDDEETESPATGDMASFGAIAALMASAVGTLTFSKKRK